MTILDQHSESTGNISLDDKKLVELIQRTGSGDKSALTALYERTSPLLYGLVSQIIKDTGSAEEVLLDIYSQVFKQSASYDSQHRMPLTWLTAIARDQALTCLHWNRRRQYKPKTPTDDLMTVAPESEKFVRSVLESLTPVQREIIELAYYSNLSCGEIAAQIGRPFGAVKTHARIGIIKLSELFQPLFERKSN